MPITGPDFIALQVRDPERAAEFYETRLGMKRAENSPPGAVVFDTKPIAFAVREPLPGLDLENVSPWAGAGIALWMHADDTQTIHDELAAAGVEIVTPPAPGPFGLMFTFRDLDGYAITVHADA